MVPIFKPCVSANTSSSGRRAIVPSAFMISIITAAGASPAMRAKSTPASVWPARFRTPPALATSGKICPGWRISLGVASRSTAFRMVCARCEALMPGPTWSAASMDTVKFVSCCERLSRTISGIRNCRARSSVMGMQIRPQASVAIKLIISGVTFSAAMIRSPSFSRSSSSMRMTIRPARMSSSISGTEARLTVFSSADHFNGNRGCFAATDTQCSHATLLTVLL